MCPKFIKPVIILIFAFTLITSIKTLAEISDSTEGLPPNIQEYVKNIQVPEYLYHWLSANSLRDLSAKKAWVKNLGKFPLKSNIRKSMFGYLRPAQYGTKPIDGGELFAWSNPILGMGTINATAYDEVYARPGLNLWNTPEDKEAPRLLVLKINSNARVKVVLIRSKSDFAPKVYDKTDIVFAMRFEKQNLLLYQEWIILNPDIVEKYTADPEIGKTHIDAELSRLKNKDFQLELGDRHFFENPGVTESKFSLPSHYKKLLDMFRQSTKADVPANMIQLSTKKCESLFSAH